MVQILLFVACIPFIVAQEPTEAEIQDLSTRNADFATRLYRAVASTTDDNVLLSPYTASVSLAAVMSGAQGSTREQLLDGLSIKSLDPQRIPDLFENVQKSVGQSGLSQSINILTSQQFTVPSEFSDLVEKRFGGTVNSLDFTNTQAAKDNINELAQRLTASQVKDVVSAINTQTQMMLINAAFFQGPFALAFNANTTQDERFYINKYNIVQVPMMFRSDKYHLAYDGSLKLGVLKLPMLGGAAMLVLLPDEEVDITSVEEKLTADRFQGWLKQLKRTKLEVQFPRFKLAQSYPLQRFLPGVGIGEVFQDTADLSGIVGDKGPKLSEFVHKVGITVDETNTGAGSGSVMFASLPPRLTINRPFLFLIYHEMTGSLLLMGRVVDPSKM